MYVVLLLACLVWKNATKFPGHFLKEMLLSVMFALMFDNKKLHSEGYPNTSFLFRSLYEIQL